MKTFRALCLAGAAIALSLPAHAITVNFDALPFGDLGSPTYVSPYASFVSAGDSLYNINHSPYTAICAFNNSFDCKADLTVNFTTAVKDLTFSTFGYNIGDSVTVNAFNGVTALGSIIVTADQIVNLTGLGTITSLLLDDNSTQSGYSYGNFVFNLAGTTGPDGSDVPLPAALPMLLTGLGALGGLRRLRRD